MPGSSTTPGHTDARTSAPVRVAFRPVNSVGTQDKYPFAAQWLAYALPADASPVPSRAPTHGSGPMRFATPSTHSSRRSPVRLGMQDYSPEDGEYVTGSASVYPAYP